MRTLTIAAVAAALLSAATAAHAAPTFTTIDNPADPTFNQLLGINNKGVISGYFGSGMAGHPNKAYTIAAPYTAGTYQDANVPGSVQTQATGINDAGDVTQFWSDTNTGTDANFGSIRIPDGAFFEYLSLNDPLVSGTPFVDQVLGVNKAKIAVGFYNAGGNAHGYAYNLASGALLPININNAVAVTATGINNVNTVSGFYLRTTGFTHAFLTPLNGGKPIDFKFGTAKVTQFFGVNDNGIAVGSFAGNDNIPHGLIYDQKNGKAVQLDMQGVTTGTVLNGLNNKNQIVGFYTDAAGNVHGMLVTGATIP